jgi:hypothetical protein
MHTFTTFAACSPRYQRLISSDCGCEGFLSTCRYAPLRDGAGQAQEQPYSIGDPP